jgi:hypothetical protein
LFGVLSGQVVDSEGPRDQCKDDEP